MKSCIQNQKTNQNSHDLHIGLESGCDDVLKQLNKGYTAKQAYETLEKLQNSKMKYISLLMGGAGGKKYRDEHIRDTAKLLSTYPPKMISIITTGIATGTKLAEMRDNGEFVQLTEREVIEDEIRLIEALDVPGQVYFFGHHQNNVARVSGHLKDKDGLVDGFRKKLNELEMSKPEILDIALTREYL